MHFVAMCRRYPQFALNVHALRPYYDERGLKMESTVVHFVNGVFDSKEAGLSDREASIVHEALRNCKQFPPLYGQQILVKEYPPEEKRADTPALVASLVEPKKGLKQ